MMDTGGWTRTTCPYCGVGCGVLAQQASDGSTAVKGDPDHPANFGRLCSKGSALGETMSLDDRLYDGTLIAAPLAMCAGINDQHFRVSRAGLQPVVRDIGRGLIIGRGAKIGSLGKKLSAVFTHFITKNAAAIGQELVGGFGGLSTGKWRLQEFSGGGFPGGACESLLHRGTDDGGGGNFGALLPQVNQGFEIPLLLDSWWDQAWAEYTDSISAYPGEFEGVGGDDMPHFCIIRHRGGLNGLFMDYTVRPVHIRELWNLRWHRGYPVNTDPPVWPEWVDGIY